MLQKKSTKEVLYIISLDDIFPDSVTINSIDSISIKPSGLSYASTAVLTVETEGIPVGRGISIQFSSGSDGYEYCITFIVTGTDLKEYEVIATLVVSDSTVVNDTEYYGTVWQSDDYFKNRLNSDAWTDATNPNKRAALHEATRYIDRLAFKGSKASTTQTLQVPRNTDTEEPKSIKEATYELAFQLLDDIDPDLEYDDLRTKQDRYADIRAERDTSWAPEHIQAGIPSMRAWHLLKPFLRDSRSLKLTRGG